MAGCVSNLLVCNLACNGQLEILANKSLATRTDQDSRTALHWAWSAGHTEIVEFLLQLGVPVNDKDDAGWFPLHIAASAGWDEILKALLGKGAQVNAVNQNGRTPLHYAASKNRHEIAVMLLEGGANPDAKDHYEATAMHRAAERVEEAKLLVSHRASIYIENKEEKTPLRVAKGGLAAWIYCYLCVLLLSSVSWKLMYLCIRHHLSHRKFSYLQSLINRLIVVPAGVLVLSLQLSFQALSNC
uniref:26S proteasome non-ATPase regulatory subunit 10 n=1 Tax=Microcebus murinus TaxID=30608 RepID=A0A8C5XLP2_MICMU